MEQLVRGKHGRLLEDEKVRQWCDNLCGDPKVTTSVYTGRLGSYGR